VCGAALAKKVGQERCAFLRQHATGHLRVVVDGAERKDIVHRARRAGFGVTGSVDDPRQPRVQCGPGAHGARFERDVQRTARQAVVAPLAGRRTQGQHFRVGTGVAAGDGGVVRGGKQLPARNDDGTYRHFADGGGGMRLGNGRAHPAHIVKLRHAGIVAARPCLGQRRLGRTIQCARYAPCRPAPAAAYVLMYSDCTPAPARGTHRCRGFTLVELLAALAVMALLALLSWRGLDGMLRAREATHARDQQQALLQTVLAQWNADLDALLPLEHTQAIDWDGQVLRLTRRSSAAADDGAWVVAWTRRPLDGLWLRWQSQPLRTRGEWNDAWLQAAQWGRNPSSAQRRLETALLQLQQWRLYYWRDNAWSNPLSSAADQPPPRTPQRSVLPGVPDGIRLELHLPEGAAVSGTLRVDWVNPLRSVNRS